MSMLDGSPPPSAQRTPSSVTVSSESFGALTSPGRAMGRAIVLNPGVNTHSRPARW